MDESICDRNLFFRQFYPLGFGLKTRFPGDTDSRVDGDPPATDAADAASDAADVLPTREAAALGTGSGEGGTRFAQQQILAAVWGDRRERRKYDRMKRCSINKDKYSCYIIRENRSLPLSKNIDTTSTSPNAATIASKQHYPYYLLLPTTTSRQCHPYCIYCPYCRFPTTPTLLPLLPILTPPVSG